MEFGLYPNMGKENLYSFIEKLVSILEDKKINYFIADYAQKTFEEKKIHISENHYKSRAWMGKHLKHILSIGGDGSYLEAAKAFADDSINLTGIHLGELGFLNSVCQGDVGDRIAQILENNYRLESRMFLSSYILHADGEKTILPDVLNDIVIGRNQIGKMVRVRLWINDTFAQQYPSDGLIISTPTGSTGYSFSCGGPILHSAARQMLVVPVCAHTLAKYSSVLSGNDVVKITLPKREGTLHISADGKGNYALKNDDILIVKSCEKPIRFVRFADQDFWGTLSDKLVKKI